MMDPKKKRRKQPANPNWKFIHPTSNRACGAHTSVMKQARRRRKKAQHRVIGQHRAKPASSGRACGGALCKVRGDVMSHSATSSFARVCGRGKKTPEDCLRSRYSKRRKKRATKRSEAASTVLMISQKKTKTYANGATHEAQEEVRHPVEMSSGWETSKPKNSLEKTTGVAVSPRDLYGLVGVVVGKSAVQRLISSPQACGPSTVPAAATSAFGSLWTSTHRRTSVWFRFVLM